MVSITQIRDVIDNDIVIYRHDETGFYSITKALVQYKELYPNTPQKKVNHWNQLASTKALTEAIKETFSINNVSCIVGNAGNDLAARGTYVHRHLYRAFLNWVDPVYQIRVMSIIDEAQERLNNQLKHELHQKDDKIDVLEDLINQMRQEQREAVAEQRKRDEDQYILLNKTHSEAESAHAEASKAHLQAARSREILEDLTITVDTIHDSFTNTAYHSTPIVEPRLTTYFALTSINGENGNINFRAWRGQKKYIEHQLIQAMATEDHELVIPPTYVAGPINVPIDAMRKIRDQLTDLATDHNNNRERGSPRWSYGSLLRQTGLRLVKVNPVWTPNDHITREDMVGAYITVIRDSQGRSFHVPEMSEELQAAVDDRRLIYEERLEDATENAREYLEAMAEMIRVAHERMNAPIEE